MVTFSEPVTDETIREAVRTWIVLLGEDRHEEALDMLYQGDKAPDRGVPEEYGGHWTPSLLRQVVSYYGLFEPYDGYYEDFDEEPYKVVPLRDEDTRLCKSGLKVK